MEILIQVGQLLLSLALLIVIHEFGHFMFAKLFKTRVEKFYLFFNPWFSLFKIKKGETEYGIGWVPLGGYVKISGMIDESMDKEQLKKPPKPWEFRSKPAWQRLLIMLGGILFNLIAGFIIFISVVMYWGDSYIPKKEVNEQGIVAYELGKEIGLKTGDKILKVNGQDYTKFKDIVNIDVFLKDNSYYTVQRGDSVFKIYLPEGFIDKFSSNSQSSNNNFIDVRNFPKIANVSPGSPATKGGLKKEDVIVKINSDTVYYHQLSDIIKNNVSDTLRMQVKRGEEKEELKNINVVVGKDSLIGIAYQIGVDLAFKKYSFGESIAEGADQATSTIEHHLTAFKKIFTGEISAQKSLVGPIGIAGIFGGKWNWYKFWNLTGLISLVLAIVNLLPIPALDGGHVLFLLYEVITGRKPSEKFLEYAQMVGMILILSLMVFVIGNDIMRLFR